ncbi:MAG: hypothetical protein H7Y15_19665 [Pseudonocardia sp.]|nr:hypothetical protein [Pseudonocardia sp.]
MTNVDDVSDIAWRARALAEADALYEHAVRVSGAPTEEDRRWVARILDSTVGDVPLAADPDGGPPAGP